MPNMDFSTAFLDSVQFQRKLNLEQDQFKQKMDEEARQNSLLNLFNQKKYNEDVRQFDEQQKRLNEQFNWTKEYQQGLLNQKETPKISTQNVTNNDKFIIQTDTSGNIKQVPNPNYNPKIGSGDGTYKGYEKNVTEVQSGIDAIKGLKDEIYSGKNHVKIMTPGGALKDFTVKQAEQYKENLKQKYLKTSKVNLRKLGLDDDLLNRIYNYAKSKKIDYNTAVDKYATQNSLNDTQVESLKNHFGLGEL